MTESERNDLVLFKLDEVLTRLDDVENRLHDGMHQVKARLSILGKQVTNMGEVFAAQWEYFDKHEKRLYKLEHPSA